MCGETVTGGHCAGLDTAVTLTGPPGVVEALTLAVFVAGFCDDSNDPLKGAEAPGPLPAVEG